VVPGGTTVEAPHAHAEGTHAEHRHEPATAVPEKEEPVPEPVEKEATPAEPVAITDSGFAEAISSGVVLVDFWAPWCAWCRRLAPTIKKLAADYDGRAVVATLNTDENRGSPGRYGVRGLPTVVVFKDGKEFARLVGFRPEKDLRAVLDEALKTD
jgi:thioredoxin 1